ncbi:bifunctional 3-phosphoshikimate 1-carboxyvinyltransferase/cytidylate kinase [Rhodocyclus tenuis]|uniref:bifunctional 3-phosphoshikimate 1-carboxyvinyltransferase/cytidylate kinase n=1 Tax=Rhodocyclus gracilis TaxID=2929842 RepID=UPI001298DFB8|nr:bifunctional 3-phosphoshikimate 1-carboxyvinyltransferase/cytidylate kinase [Rhodocyclus gracilis]MRD71731.1 bifunctional 3-phosphoshikimate 1-carboxyvinyltransferase/cytidylate kinase [Rhodocyclus gracilis]
MDFIDLPQCLGAGGVVRLPGSKSISNRVLLLAALAEGETEIRDLLVSDDTERMLDALRTLGVNIQPLPGVAGTDEACTALNVRVDGVGGAFAVRKADLFLGNAGTAFRPLTAVLALMGGCYRLTGTPRMHERPIGDLVDALRQAGADIRYLATEGYPPLAIGPRAVPDGGESARKESAGRIRVRGDVSSQFLSALLMALPLIGGGTVEVVGELISRPYINITLATMARFGVDVRAEGVSAFIVPAGGYRSPGVVHVEGDASAASYFLALGALAGGPVRVEGVGRQSVQGDVRFVEALTAMGARVSLGENWIEAAAPVSGRLAAIDLDCNAIPDAAMTLAPLAVFADGVCTLRNIGSWRVKETDRLAAMAVELAKLGACVEEGADFLRITPPTAGVRPAMIDTYDDHRMAMCFSLASVGAPVRINDPGCVAKTFPEYFQHFARLTRVVPVIAIDGPSASGKGTVAARVAATLGWNYLDSGALYRLTALAAQRAGVAWDDEPAVAAIAAGLDVVFAEGSIRLAGEEVEDAIRQEEISSGASQVAVLPSVRAALLFRQRAFCRAPGLVADGRDMASVVFTDAALKVFLTASVEARAERRYKQLMAKGIAARLQPLLLEMQQRDDRDRGRSVAPLQQDANASLLDTTDIPIDVAVARVLDWARAVVPDIAGAAV